MTHSRILAVVLFPTLAFCVLFVRLFDLQVIQGSQLRQMSEDNRYFKKRVLANRGIIKDRFGTPIVLNKPVYYRLSTPKRLYSDRQIVTEADALQMLATSSAHIFSQSYRQYVFPEALSQVTGYVGAVTQEDLESDAGLHINQIIGKTGIEREFEQQLKGVDGSEIFELNAYGEIQRQVGIVPAREGENLILSIDAQLSQRAYELMEGKTGAVVVGDAQTGEVLALVSTPTYNPNLFTVPLLQQEDEADRRAQLQGYFTDARRLFFNRALAGAYPPGSVFKLITALAGLELGKIDESTIVVDEGQLRIDEYVYGNWYFRQYGRTEGPINLVRSIARSNDIFFYKAAEWIGPQQLADFARLMGLGKRTEIELPAETAGTVPDPEWKQRVIGERWYLGNTYHYGIGQGDVTVTPLQVFHYTTAFAHEGKMCRPTLIKGKTGQCEELALDARHIAMVRQGMIEACSTGGTAFPFFAWNEEHEQEKVACKTGTAEFGGVINDQGYRKTHGWFTAIVELPDSSVGNSEGGPSGSDLYPRSVVITVLVESDEEQPFREGSRDAAPIAKELAAWLEEHR